jgi:F0F1-type ATP synthase epsilon subunit
MMKLSGKARLKVKVISPTKTHFNGLAMSVSAVNKVGPFDLLADHANFFSLLSQGDIVVDTGYQKFTFPITKGIVKVHDNTVTLFIDIEPGQTPPGA